jgi:hypothetical protein
MHNELANMPLLQPYCSEQMASVKSCMLVQVPDAPDVRYEPQKQALPHTAHTTALEATRQPIDVSIHVTNVPADAETVDRDSGKLTRQQDRVSTATSSQQDGRQFVASGRKICLPTESPHESSPKPSSESHAEDICPVVQTDIIFSRLIVVKDKMDQFPCIQTQGSLPNFKRFRKVGFLVALNPFSQVLDVLLLGVSQIEQYPSPTTACCEKLAHFPSLYK